MKLRMCKCNQCKRGRKTKTSQTTIIAKKRAARHLAKQLLHLGEYEKLVQVVNVGYTD